MQLHAQILALRKLKLLLPLLFPLSFYFDKKNSILIHSKRQASKLRQTDHKYLLENDPSIEFYNVTNLVEDQFPPFEREKIAQWLVKNSYKYSGYSVEELLQEWEDIKNKGTETHREMENYIRYGKIPTLNKARSGMNWYKEEIKKFGDKVFPEVIVFSEELKIAGTIDLLVYNSNDCKISIFDWKTTINMNYSSTKNAITRACSGLTDCKYDQYSLQLSIYSYLLERYHDVEVSDHYIVHLMESDANCIEGKKLYSHVENIFDV